MTTADHELRQYINSLTQGRESTSVAGYVLRQGRVFQPWELTPAELDYIAMINWERCPEKQCWYNCQMAALTLPPTPGITLRYVEGYVYTGLGIGIEHAWLSVNRKTVDPTLRVQKGSEQRVIGVIPKGWAYYGVEMDPKECRHVLQHGESISLIDDYQCSWPKIPGRRVPTRDHSLHSDGGNP